MWSFAALTSCGEARIEEMTLSRTVVSTRSASIRAGGHRLVFQGSVHWLTAFWSSVRTVAGLVEGCRRCGPLASTADAEWGRTKSMPAMPGPAG